MYNCLDILHSRLKLKDEQLLLKAQAINVCLNSLNIALKTTFNNFLSE